MFLFRKKNRKWFSREVSRARGGYVDARRASDPVVVAAGVFVALVFAIISGRAIDYRRAGTGSESARYSIAPGVMSGDLLESGVHYLADSRFPSEPRGPQINAAVTSQPEGALSGAVNSAPLVLLPSLAPGFALNKVGILASLDRPGTFIELSLGGSANGSYVLRITSTGITTSFLIPSGERTVLETLSLALSGSSVVLTPKPDGIEVSQKGDSRKVLSGIDLRSGRVSLSTNLRQMEVCSIVGSWDAVQDINLLTGTCKPPLSY